MVNRIIPKKFAENPERTCGLFIFACGFEDRATYLFRELGIAKSDTPIVAARFVGGPIENQTSELVMKDVTVVDRVHRLDLPSHPDFTHDIEVDARSRLQALRDTLQGEVWFDISGFPNWAICVLLKCMTDVFPPQSIRILYSAASSYYPLRENYDSFLSGKKSSDSSPEMEALTYRVRSNLVPECFSGNNIDIGQACLIAFVGYESHRTQAAIEDINPSKIVAVFGEPPSDSLRWRLEMSHELHKKVLGPYQRSERVVATNDVAGALDLIKLYYSYLFEDHMIRVCPMNSKLHAVACFCAWKRFPDIQLCMPQPVRFLPNRFSIGVSECFEIALADIWAHAGSKSSG